MRHGFHARGVDGLQLSDEVKNLVQIGLSLGQAGLIHLNSGEPGDLGDFFQSEGHMSGKSEVRDRLEEKMR